MNGDIIEWVKDNKSGEMEPVWVEPHSVGFNISTKAVGSALRLDVTDLYKYKEGSKEERSVVSRLAKFRCILVPFPLLASCFLVYYDWH